MNEPYGRIAELLDCNLPLFTALADASRQKILLIMACQERLSVGELASMTALSRPAVSHHIKILKQAGLLLEERDGTKRYYRPTFHDSVINLKALVDEIVQKSALNET